MAKQYVLDMTRGNVTSLLLRFTLPMLIGNIFQQFYNMVDSIIVGHFVGTNALGAVGSVGSITFMFFSLCLGLGSGIGILISQYFGAGQDDYVKKIIANAICITLATGALMSLCGVCFGEPILRIFIDEPEVIRIGAKGLRITSLMYFGLGLIYVMRGMLNGVGDAFFAMINGVTEVIGRIGFAFLFMMIPSVGMWGVWYTNGLTWTLTGLVNVIRVLQGKWVTKAVVNNGGGEAHN